MEKSSRCPSGDEPGASRIALKWLDRRKERLGSLSFVAKDMTDITVLLRASEDDIE
jgi:hypothetical protein